jgi:hypothetical protein
MIEQRFCWNYPTIPLSIRSETTIELTGADNWAEIRSGYLLNTNLKYKYYENMPDLILASFIKKLVSLGILGKIWGQMVTLNEKSAIDFNKQIKFLSLLSVKLPYTLHFDLYWTALCFWKYKRKHFLNVIKTD